MKTFLHWVLQYFVFAGTMFATGATVGDLGGGGGQGDPNPGAGGGDELPPGDDGAVGDDAAGDLFAESDDPDAAAESRANKPATTEEAAAQEFKGAVSSRLKAMVKTAPALAQVFKENPKIQEQIEAGFRREAAYRECFPTVAEARQFRDEFPNGLADVQALREDVQEVEQLDQHFYTRNAEGNYTGHATILDNMFKDDRDATIAFLKTAPKEWARLDRDSYNEFGVKLVGATLQSRGIPEFLNELLESASGEEKPNAALVNGLKKMIGWAGGYTKPKAAPSEDEQRLQRDKDTFNRQTADRTKEEGTRFHNQFVGESRKLQLGIINQHPSMLKLAKVTSITAEKRTAIAAEIRNQMEKFLGKSPAFMRKLRPAHEGRNLQECLTLQKANWSQQWLLNRMVRSVLSKEVPQLVSQNRDTAARRASAAPVRPPARSGGNNNATKGPVKLDGQWYRDGGKGAKFTTAEVLAGKHLL